jgi:antitoxin component YwqK of YwqJK toxin-antitoxin module
MGITLILIIVVWGLHFYLKYKDRQNTIHMRSGGSHFINSETNKPFSKTEFDNKLKEGLEIFEEYLDEPKTNDLDRNKEVNEDVKIFYYDNGQKRQEETYKEGKLDGLRTFWSNNGQKTSEGTWKDGKEDGLSTHWWDNGQMGSEGPYKDGKLDGLHTEWYYNGQKKDELTFKDGKLISKKEWNEDGSVKE